MTMRLFIAINFNNETRSRLLALRDELRGKSERGNFPAPENLHLTLVFIGNASPSKVDKIKAIMDTFTFASFTVTIERLGTFSQRSGGRVCGKINRLWIYSGKWNINSRSAVLKWMAVNTTRTSRSAARL